MAKPQTVVPCFGINCEVHADCKRYALIEGSTPGQVRLGFCGRVGERSAFLPIVEEERKVWYEHIED